MSRKQLSSPFSAGGGGHLFEAHVQALFVVRMLVGVYAPNLPCWPIVQIKVQGKGDGFSTDDLIVFVQDKNSKEQRKLLGQVKSSINITRGSALFGKVIQAAWNDFNNPKVFFKGKDIIALITGPLNRTDIYNVRWLLGQARYTKNVDEFFRNQENFSSAKSTEKLEAFQHHLKTANGGNEVSRGELYNFLKHFHLLGYDLGDESGVDLSLLHSHISQFQQQNPQLQGQNPKLVWSRIVEFVQRCNQNAVTITPDNLLDDILEVFKQKPVTKTSKESKEDQERPKTDWTQHSDATNLALIILIGAWQDKYQCDREAIKKLLGISYDEWLKKAQEILHLPDSPLSLKNGTWKIVNRTELWELLGSRILDQNLDTFKSLAVSVLEELDPAFELPAEERYAANIHGKILEHSSVLRKGIAEGLAILGSQPDACVKCSQGEAEVTSVLVIRQLLTDANWVLWGSLNDLLPILAEAAPVEFLDWVENAMHLTPSPFDKLFSQESSGITGRNYLTGLLWALEGLAWDEQHIVRACVVLSELASHDPGGQWGNRPSNSLAIILFPWFPQTLASVDKRKVAVKTILKEWPDIAWHLIIQLLPGQHQTSIGSYKPNWRNIIPDDWEKKGVTQQEYWQQVSFYAELAVEAAGQDIARLSELIDHFDNLPEPASDQFLQVLASQSISELSEEQRSLIWGHLTKFINKHRRFSDAKWALPDEPITRIEQVAKQLAPTNPFNLFQHLFTERDFDLYDENDNLEEQQKKLNTRRENAILQIFRQDGVEGVIRFAESVSSPSQVGHALGSITGDVIEQYLLPRFLDSTDNKHKELMRGFIWRCHFLKGWVWCDNIDKSDWTPKHIGQFLAYLPFTKEAWSRASEWLQNNENEYWTSTSANAYQSDDNLSTAIDKLIEHGRPHAVINCLGRMRYAKKPLNTKQCIQALLAALSSSEPIYAMNQHDIVELIKFLQTEDSVNQDDLDDLCRVEWGYIQLLDWYGGVTPKLLESRLANDPNFFCEIIRLIYKSKKEDQPSQEPTEKSEAMATNIWRLFRMWKTPPGTQKDGTFSEEHFTEWLQNVKESCRESGHLEVALTHIGEVLFHASSDPDGLWIHRAVAAALNNLESDDMRQGFITGELNSRGAYMVDPTGKPEKEIAKQFRIKAEAIENAGFHRFAVTLNGLAGYYDREAIRVIDEHAKDPDE